MNSTYKQVKLNYTNWFIQHLSDPINDAPNVETNYFLFTITSPFSSMTHNDSNQMANELFHVFGIFYSRICQNLVGKNYHREASKHKLPRAVAAIDVAGTKAGYVVEHTNPHLHSIIRIPKQDLDRFNETMEGVINHLEIGKPKWSFHIEEFEDDSPRHLDRAAGYLTKFTGQNANQNLVAEDVRVYPLPKGYLKPN